MKTRLFFLLSVFSILLFNPSAYSAEQVEQTPDNIHQPSSRPLHFLDNEDLLKQAETLLQSTNENYLGHSRAQKKAEMLYRIAQNDLTEFKIPRAEIDLTQANDLDSIKQLSEAAKRQLQAQQQQLKLEDNVKQRLNKRHQKNEALHLAIESFIRQLDEINEFALEIHFRVQDKSFQKKQVPNTLKQPVLKKQEQLLKTQLTMLNTERQAQKQDLEQLNKTSAKTQEAIQYTQTQIDAIDKAYQQALKRSEIEKSLMEKNLEQLQADLQISMEEKIWLQGTFNLSLRQFEQADKAAQSHQLAIKKLTDPVLQSWQTNTLLISQDDPEVAKQNVQALLPYYDIFLQEEKSLYQAFLKIDETGKILSADTRILRDHLFNMEVLADLFQKRLEQKEDMADKEKQAFTLKVQELHDTRTEVLNKDSYLQKRRQDAHTYLAHYQDTMEKTLLERQQAVDALESLSKSQDMLKNLQNWEAKIKDLSSEQLLKEFIESQKDFTQGQLSLEQKEIVFNTAKDSVSEIQAKLDDLHDPLTRQALLEIQDYKLTLKQQLYSFAHFELPKTDTVAAPETHQNTTEKNNESDKNNSSEKEKTPHQQLVTTTLNEKQAKQAEIEAEYEKHTQSETVYQNLLTSRVTVLNTFQTHRTDLLKAMNIFQKETTAYAEVLRTTQQAGLRNYANAVALKKALGRGEVTLEKVPDKVTEALQQEQAKNLEEKALMIESELNRIQERLLNLQQNDTDISQMQELMTNIQDQVGVGLNLLDEIKNLQKKFEEQQGSLTDIEQRTSERAAMRRMQSEDTWLDVFLAFVPTPENKETSELLQAYYLELQELEDKQKNTKQQNDKWEYLLKLGEQEKELIPKLIELLHKKVDGLSIEKDTANVKIQVQLAPEQADTLLASFAARTGQRLSLPVLLPVEQRLKAIDEAVHHLYEYQVRIVTLNKWIELFQQRLSTQGLNQQLAWYSDKVTSLHAQSVALLRRIKHFTGYSKSDLEKIPETQRPETVQEKRQFFQGGIGLLRADRLQLRIRAGIQIGLVVLAIVLGAMLLALLANRFIRRLISTAQSDDSGEHDRHVLLAVSFLNIFIKIGIWALAFIMILSNLGVEIAAILAGLGIGGLALAMAAKETLSNVLGGIMIFIERPFTIGDMIQTEGQEPATVVDMTWRTTRLKTPRGYYISVPNMLLSESAIVNYTHQPTTLEVISFELSAEYTPDDVMRIVEQALGECPGVMKDQRYWSTMQGLDMQQAGKVTVVEYWANWFIDDYRKRLGIRQQVWQHIWFHLTQEGILPVPENFKEMQLQAQDGTHLVLD